MAALLEVFRLPVIVVRFANEVVGDVTPPVENPCSRFLSVEPRPSTPPRFAVVRVAARKALGFARGFFFLCLMHTNLKISFDIYKQIPENLSHSI